VNYLLDNDPSPFCDYIICKELLKEDEKTIRDSYEWAKRFKLYAEIHDEQFPDGSWGGFLDAESATNAQKRKHKATARAVWRLCDLSLDENDEMTAKTIEYCRKIIRGEITNIWGRNIEQNWVIKNAAHTALYALAPNIKEERTTDNEKQRIFMAYNWERGPWDLVKLSDLPMPDESPFGFWMCGLEGISDCFLFSEYMAEKTTPFLYLLCDKLIDPDDTIQVGVNRYYGKIGQYNETRSNKEHKKRDLLLRIIRILNKCD
jgi:hypothetical protein